MVCFYVSYLLLFDPISILDTQRLIQQQCMDIAVLQPPTLALPKLHQNITHKNNGIFSTQPIKPGELLVSTSTHNTINPYTLPTKILNIQGLDMQDKIAIYLMILKLKLKRKFSCLQNRLKQMKVHDDEEFKVMGDSRLFCQLEEQGEGWVDLGLGKWIGKVTMGFIGFDENVIKATGDEKMILQYLAYRQHYIQQSKTLQKTPQISLLINSISPGLTSQQFTQLWIQSSQFRNTRCFGYTSESLLIPIMDYFNFNPSIQNIKQKVHFITYDHVSEVNQYLQQYKKNIQNIEEDGVRGVGVGVGASGENQIEGMNWGEHDSEDEEGEGGVDVGKVKKFVGIVCVQEIGENQQIFFHYGALSNYQLIKNYGFAVRNNKFDNVIVYLSNFKREQMIYFSPVQRSTTKFHLSRSLNLKFVSQWIKMYEQSHSRHGAVNILIKHMKEYQPPSNLLKQPPQFHQPLTSLLTDTNKNSAPVQKLPPQSQPHNQICPNNEAMIYLQIFQAQQYSIYNNSIELVINYMQQLKEQQEQEQKQKQEQKQ